MPTESSPVRASHVDRDRAVEALRIASSEGSLTAEELDDRLEIALTATTQAELAAVVVDLPVAPVAGDLVIEQTGGKLSRTGAWVVPEVIRMDTKMTKVTLDFREAVISSPTLRIEGNVKHGKLVIIGGRNIAIDTDGAVLVYSKVKLRSEAKAAEPRLRIVVSAKFKHSALVEKRAK